VYPPLFPLFLSLSLSLVFTCLIFHICIATILPLR
jgi:hypothetical protein